MTATLNRAKNRSSLRITNNGTCSKNLLRSAPREDAFDERCGASRGRFHGLSAGPLVPVALAAANPSGLRSEAASLRANDESLEARANAATLELYALEAELRQARSAVESVAARQEVVARDRAAVRKQLAIARNALHVSEAQLAELVRALYEHSGTADPLAILLGAASLDEALTGLDSLSRAAGENSRIIEQARSSRKRLAVLDERLAAREAELTQLAAAAAARTSALAEAAGTRERFVAALRHQQGLNAARISSIEAQARRAEARTLAISATVAPVATAVVETAAPAAPAEPVATSGATITVSTTGYTLQGPHHDGRPDHVRGCRRRSVGDPARDAAADPRLRRGDRRRHRWRDPGKRHRSLVPVDRRGAALGPSHRHDHDPLRRARCI